MRIIACILLLFLSTYIYAQDTLKVITDTLVTEDTLAEARILRDLDPSKAAARSAMLPGLGQFYNRDYWKTPIAAGAVAVSITAIIYTTRQKNIYGDALQTRIYDTTQIDQFAGELTTEVLLQRRHRYTSLHTAAILATAYTYGLNILEAYADAQVRKLPEAEHYPVKAAFYSAILPGLGQAYNRKYWKIPIAIGAMGTGIFFIVDNSITYNDLRSAYITRIDDDPQTYYETEFTIDYSLEELISASDEFKRFRDISFFVTAGIYLLNIVDAVVDAHLYNFNIDDDLSLDISPEFHNFATNSFAPSGVRLTIKF